MRKLYVACLIAFLFCTGQSMGQSVTPAVTFNVAGGSYGPPGSYYRFEWSLGEASLVHTATPPDNSLYLTQGVLQPVTEKSQLSPYLAAFQKGEYYLFPNPTAGVFEVNFSVRVSGRLELQLTDRVGRVLKKTSYRYNGWGHIEKYNLSTMPNGTYFVIATLTPDTPRPGDYQEIIRHSGFRVVKLK